MNGVLKSDNKLVIIGLLGGLSMATYYLNKSDYKIDENFGTSVWKYLLNENSEQDIELHNVVEDTEDEHICETCGHSYEQVCEICHSAVRLLAEKKN